MLGNAAINAKLSRSLGLTIKEIAPILAVGGDPAEKLFRVADRADYSPCRARLNSASASSHVAAYPRSVGRCRARSVIVQNQGRPAGVTVARKMRPTTLALPSRTSKSSSNQWPLGRLLLAWTRMSSGLRPCGIV